MAAHEAYQAENKVKVEAAKASAKASRDAFDASQQ